MDNLSNPAVIRNLLERHGFSFSKALGQNFLINPAICPKMAQQGIDSSDWGVLEIGAGVGVLTQELARRGHEVEIVNSNLKMGRGQIIWRSGSGLYVGGTEPRCDGAIAAW